MNKKRRSRIPGYIFLRLLIAAGFLVLAGAGTGVYILTRPKPVWVVEGAYEKQWEEVLALLPPRFTRIEIRQTADGSGLPKNSYGFIITDKSSALPQDPPANAPKPEDRGEPPRMVALYPHLADTGEYRHALVLALDPWMIFRKYSHGDVSRSRIDSLEGGEGFLIAPGLDPQVVWAWTAQLLQERPGVFPQNPAVWEAAAGGLFRGRRFQQGALTYRWDDALPLFFRSTPAWLYAPFSRIRRLSPQQAEQAGGIEAARFPERADWNEFGIQADILWAIPFGKPGDIKKLAPTAVWLRDPKTQTAIANKLGWIPAHRDGTPYNAAAGAARLAWLSSSFVWQPPPEAD
jgi:hypothetical protein